MFRTKQSRTEAAVDQARATAADLGSAASDRLDALKHNAAASASPAPSTSPSPTPAAGGHQ